VSLCVPPPVFVCTDEELAALKASIQQSLMLLPENALVGLVTFGKNVHVHELSFDECPKSYVFRGDKELSAQQIATYLGLRPSAKDQKSAPTAPPSAADASTTGATAAASGLSAKAARFLMPVSACEFQLNAILDDLSKDCWQYKNTERQKRCTGTALGLAIGLLESTYKNLNARIMMFCGGAPTEGPVCAHPSSTLLPRCSAAVSLSATHLSLSASSLPFSRC
jgi:protein transport protein SEC23